jgi:hypothetical protein
MMYFVLNTSVSVLLGGYQLAEHLAASLVQSTNCIEIFFEKLAFHSLLFCLVIRVQGWFLASK